MRIILDANILFSALIKDSITRSIILNYEGFFLFPAFIFEELRKHEKDLLQKAGMSKSEFNKLLGIILQKVMVVPNEALLPYREEAFRIVKDIDQDDLLFIACALAYPGSTIWSNDQKLKTQNKIKIINTSEMMKII